jgi:hypothetical protein
MGGCWARMDAGKILAIGRHAAAWELGRRRAGFREVQLGDMQLTETRAVGFRQAGRRVQMDSARRFSWAPGSIQLGDARADGFS